MPHQPAAWLQVSGYRFLLRRLESALLTGDVNPPGGRLPQRSAPLALGCALAVIATAVSALLAALRPQPALDQAQIVLTRDSGALYVRVGDTWHPTLNLASARLIAGTAANPQPVREADLARTKRGPLLGIPGAPQDFGRPLSAEESVWTMCAGGGAGATTVLVGSIGSIGSAARLDANRAVLVAPESGSPAYLLYQGQRAVVDLADPAVQRALGLEGRAPRPVSQLLLNAIPEAPPIAAPPVRDRGATTAGLPGFAVGSVLRVARADGDAYYVVLAHGVQRIGQVAAEVLRYSGSAGAANALTLAPDAIRAAAIVDTLPVASFPDRAPALVDGDGVVCVARNRGSDTALLAGGGLPIPAGRVPVTLSQADGRGPALDAVYLPPGRSAYVTADRGGAARYLVTDTGVRFAVPDDDAARDLGLPAPVPAPWAVLAALPSGPELSRAKASIARDTVPTPP